MYLWVGKCCNETFIRDVLGLPNYASLRSNMVSWCVCTHELFSISHKYLFHPVVLKVSCHIYPKEQDFSCSFEKATKMTLSGITLHWCHMKSCVIRHYKGIAYSHLINIQWHNEWHLNCASHSGAYLFIGNSSTNNQFNFEGQKEVQGYSPKLKPEEMSLLEIKLKWTDIK